MKAAAAKAEAECEDAESEKSSESVKPKKQGKTISQKTSKADPSWNYAVIRKTFIGLVRKEQGVSYQDACNLWNGSDAKKELLGPLTLAELKRRKFVEKDCEANPWSWLNPWIINLIHVHVCKSTRRGGVEWQLETSAESWWWAPVCDRRGKNALAFGVCRVSKFSIPTSYKELKQIFFRDFHGHFVAEISLPRVGFPKRWLRFATQQNHGFESVNSS